jgi:lipid-binding SYLF domain-containing protein
MHITKHAALSLLVASTLLAADSGAPSEKDLKKLKEEVPTTIDNFKKADSTLGDFFKKSVGYAVLPRVAKGGFIIGGARGTGLVYEQGKLIGHVVMTQATVGAQVGGQSFSELVFFENAEALKDFQKSETTMNAQVGAVAAGEGAGKSAKYNQGVAVFTLPRSGLMAEASVGGQKFRFTAIKE